MLATTSCANNSENTYHWNLWFYLNADNNLNDQILQDMVEITDGLQSDKLNVCILIDTLDNTAEQYCLSNNEKVNRVELGEIDMTQPVTLTNFLQWAKQQGDAEQTMLVLSTHGNGWDQQTGASPQNKLSARSMFVDETNRGTSRVILHNHLIADAIAKADVRLDILGLDASIMGTIEALVEFADLADVLITSQETGYAAGWKYDDILSQLSTNSLMSHESLASVIVESYRTYYESEIDDKRYTLAAHRSESIIELAEAINDIANDLLIGMESNPDSIINLLQTARADAQKIDPIINPDVYIDLKDFLAHADLLDNSLEQHFTNATIAEYHGDQRPSANGISIVFFKDTAQVTYDRHYNNWDAETGTGNKGKFINEYLWDELIHAYYEALSTD